MQLDGRLTAHTRHFCATCFLLHSFHHLTHLSGHLFVGVDDHGRAANEALAGRNFTHFVAKLFFNEGAKRFGLAGFEPVFFGGFSLGRDSVEIDLLIIRGNEVFLLKGTRVVHDELVNRLVEVKHLDLTRLKCLDVGATLNRCATGTKQVVDLLLAFGCTREVIG